jgi:diphthamide biosynthesis protein 2
LYGTTLSTFSVLVFGTAGSYAQCVSGRFLTGLLNGNAGVVKTYIGETTDKTQQARAFSIFAMAFGVASCVAPAVGGFLQRPAERWPDTFEGTVFERYPFLLPMLFAGMLTLTGGVLGFLYVPESASQWRRMEAKASGGDAAYYARVGDDDDDDDDDEGERPYEGKDRSEALLTIVDDDGERGLKEVEMGVVKTMSGEDGTSIDAADVELGGTAAAETKKPKDDSAAAAAAAAKGLSTRGWNAHTVEAIASYAALAAIAIGYDEIFPVYAKTSTSLGGLELSAGEIGAVLVFGGVTLVTFQLFLFPRVLKALGVTGGLRFGAVAFACVALIAPTAAMVDEDDVVARWVVLLLSQARSIR